MAVTAAWKPPKWALQLAGLVPLPKKLGGNEWAEKRRVLSVKDNRQRPGKWRSIAWQKEILDALADPDLDLIVIKKASQMSASELVRNAVGRWAECDPGDVLWVMADEKSARKAMKKLHRMFRTTPSLRSLVSPKKSDTGLLEMVLLNGMRIVIGWASSAASLASDPFRYVILDEVGLYKTKVGKEGDARGLAEDRTKVYGDAAKVVLLSKPSHADDLICQSYDNCLDQREFAVPCEDCGELQPFAWSDVRWPGGDPHDAPTDPDDRILLASKVKSEHSAWVECRACGGEIRDTHGVMAHERAHWQQINDRGQKTRERAYHISEFLHWQRTVTDMVARWLKCTEPHQLQNFHTGCLGQAYQATRGEVSPMLFARRAIYRPGIVPKWATAVLATADTQKDHFWWMVRAWGKGQRSRLLAFGRAEDFKELEGATLARRWELEDGSGEVATSFLLIDAAGGTAGDTLDGSRTDDVYKWALKTPHVMPLKGEREKVAQQGIPLGWTKTQVGGTKGRGPEIQVARPNSNWFKDRLVALIRSTDPIKWEECQGAESKLYGRHMTGQRLIREEDTQGRVKWRWRKIRGKPDHLFDCAAYQVVASEIARSETRREIRPASPTDAKPKRQTRSRPGRFSTPDGRPFLANWR